MKPRERRLQIETMIRSEGSASVEDLAAHFDVSTETIRRWIRHKGLQAYNTELGLKIRIRQSDLTAFAARHNILLIEPQTATT